MRGIDLEFRNGQEATLAVLQLAMDDPRCS